LTVTFFCGEKFYEELDNNDIGSAFAKSNGFRFKTVFKPYFLNNCQQPASD